MSKYSLSVNAGRVEGGKKKNGCSLVMTSLFMWRQSAGRAVKVRKVKGEEAGVLRKHTHTSAMHADSSAHGCHAGGGTYAATNTPAHKLQSEFLPSDITPLPV